MTPEKRDKSAKESELRALRAGQHGLVTTAQAMTLQLSRSAISRRVRSGEWVTVLPGVHRDADVQPTLHQRLLAALLWAGDDAVISHRSAPALRRLEHVAEVEVHLWTPQSARSKQLTVHRGKLEPIDIRMVDGIRVTSVPRTLIDVAGLLDDESLQAIVEEALHPGLTTPLAIQRRLDALGGKGRAGSSQLRKLLARRENAPALESRLEVRVWGVLRRAGLRPVRQYTVRYDGRTYRLDFAWPALKVGIEADGYATHGGSGFERDRSRVADLAGYGWRIVPVTWRGITEDPARFIRQVRGALVEAAAA